MRKALNPARAAPGAVRPPAAPRCAAAPSPPRPGDGGGGRGGGAAALSARLGAAARDAAGAAPPPSAPRPPTREARPRGPSPVPAARAPLRWPRWRRRWWLRACPARRSRRDPCVECQLPGTAASPRVTCRGRGRSGGGGGAPPPARCRREAGPGSAAGGGAGAGPGGRLGRGSRCAAG